jgi:hypothetical protein
MEFSRYELVPAHIQGEVIAAHQKVLAASKKEE